MLMEHPQRPGSPSESDLESVLSDTELAAHAATAAANASLLRAARSSVTATSHVNAPLGASRATSAAPSRHQSPLRGPVGSAGALAALNASASTAALALGSGAALRRDPIHTTVVTAPLAPGSRDLNTTVNIALPPSATSSASAGSGAGAGAAALNGSTASAYLGGGSAGAVAVAPHYNTTNTSGLGNGMDMGFGSGFGGGHGSGGHGVGGGGAGALSPGLDEFYEFKHHMTSRMDQLTATLNAWLSAQNAAQKRKADAKEVAARTGPGTGARVGQGRSAAAVVAGSISASAVAASLPVEQRVLHARLLEVEKRLDKSDVRLQLTEDLMRLKKRQSDSSSESDEQRYQQLKTRLSKVEHLLSTTHDTVMAAVERSAAERQRSVNDSLHLLQSSVDALEQSAHGAASELDRRFQQHTNLLHAAVLASQQHTLKDFAAQQEKYVRAVIEQHTTAAVDARTHAEAARDSCVTLSERLQTVTELVAQSRQTADLLQSKVDAQSGQRLALTERVHELNSAVTAVAADVSAARRSLTQSQGELRQSVEQALSAWRDKESASLRDWCSAQQQQMLAHVTNALQSRIIPQLRADITAEVRAELRAELRAAVESDVKQHSAAATKELRADWNAQMTNVWGPRVAADARQDVTLQVLGVRDELQTGVKSLREQWSGQFTALHTHTQQLTTQFNAVQSRVAEQQQSLADLKEQIRAGFHSLQGDNAQSMQLLTALTQSDAERARDVKRMDAGVEEVDRELRALKQRFTGTLKLWNDSFDRDDARAVTALHATLAATGSAAAAAALPPPLPTAVTTGQPVAAPQQPQPLPQLPAIAGVNSSVLSASAAAAAPVNTSGAVVPRASPVKPSAFGAAAVAAARAAAQYASGALQPVAAMAHNTSTTALTPADTSTSASALQPLPPAPPAPVPPPGTVPPSAASLAAQAAVNAFMPALATAALTPVRRPYPHTASALAAPPLHPTSRGAAGSAGSAGAAAALNTSTGSTGLGHLSFASAPGGSATGAFGGASALNQTWAAATTPLAPVVPSTAPRLPLSGLALRSSYGLAAAAGGSAGASSASAPSAAPAADAVNMSLGSAGANALASAAAVTAAIASLTAGK